MNPRPLLLALALLTRIPVRLDSTPTPDEQGASVAMYPVVGLILGLLLLMLAGLIGALGGTPLVTATVVVAVWAGLTGALHLDGLADTADAWLGGHSDPNRTLEIMKDPASGPVGVVAVVLVLLLKIAAVAALLEQPGWTWPLLLAPVLGRSACALLFVLVPYVRPDGIGEEAKDAVLPGLIWGVVAGMAVLVLLLTGFAGAMMILVSALGFWWATSRMRLILGGFTGDTAGASVELVEALALLTAALVLS